MEYTYSTPVTDNVIVLGNDYILNADEVLTIDFSSKTKISILFKNGYEQTIHVTPQKLKEYTHIIITYYNTLMR